MQVCHVHLFLFCMQNFLFVLAVKVQILISLIKYYDD